MEIAFFNRFTIEMTENQARAASHAGQCDDDVAALEPVIAPQLDAIGPEAIRAELAEYGAWDSHELSHDTDNRLRIVWIAACNIRENLIESKRHNSRFSPCRVCQTDTRYRNDAGDAVCASCS